MESKKKREAVVVDAEIVESKELQISPDFLRELPEIEAEFTEPEPEVVVETAYFEESKEYLRCMFSDAEIIDLSKKLARQLSEQQSAERELKEISTQLKANVTAKETAVAFTAGLVQNGYEYRTVECQRFFDNPDKGRKSLFRMDTGELVSIDRMSGDDLQGQLFRNKQGQEGRAK